VAGGFISGLVWGALVSGVVVVGVSVFFSETYKETVAQKPEILKEDAAVAKTVPEAMKTPEIKDALAEPTPEPEAAKVEPKPQIDTQAVPDLPAPDPKISLPPVETEPETTAKMPEPAPEAAPQETENSIRKPVPGIANMAPQIETGRLPSIGSLPDTGTDAASMTAAKTEPPASDLGALAAYGATFENPNALPLMAIILIDNPDAPISDAALANLSFSVSFAIDAVREDATDVAARYRKAGFEVLMLTNLPLGADPSDIETAFQAYSRAVPEAIGVLDLGANGFLRGASSASQIAEILAEGGFGLVTPSKGLNTAQKAATREGVPAALIFRQLDENDEKGPVIRRFLDRAAFRAKQEGHVIMLGQTRPQTLEALVQWALEDRAAAVAIGPVSAVLKGL